jgi:hypothetical protein
MVEAAEDLVLQFDRTRCQQDDDVGDKPPAWRGFLVMEQSRDGSSFQQPRRCEKHRKYPEKMQSFVVEGGNAVVWCCVTNVCS